MVICHSGKSAISANLIADEDDNIFTNRGSEGDVNWGRAQANTLLNPDISNSTNKRIMRELFREYGVPTPRLYHPDLVAFEKNPHIFPLVGRPDTHTRGRGFWLCGGVDDARKALRGTRKKKPATHFMAFVDAPREYRAHIFKGKSIRISEKEFFVDEQGKRTYITVKPQHDVREVRKAAKQALEAVGLDFGAVDVLARGDSNDEVFVLEVNAAPGLGGSLPRLYAEVFTKYIKGEW